MLKLMLALLMLSTTALADGLVVAPTRLVLAPGQKTAEAALTNTSEKAMRYRLSLIDEVMQPNGTVRQLKDGETFAYSAHDMIRFMPRLVSLEPGQRQTVRLMVTRPEAMPDGDYHSHLLLDEIPQPRGAANAVSSTGLTLEVGVTYSMGLPVVVQQGKLTGAVALVSATLVRDAAGKPTAVKATLSRSGNSEGAGYLTVTYAGKGASTPRIVRLYHEVDLAELTLPILSEVQAFKPAQLTVQLRKGPSEKDAVVTTLNVQ